MIYATFCKSLMRIQDIKNNLEAAWPRLISLSKAPVPTIVRPLLARAVAYKLSLVWMSNKLTNEEPQEFHWPSHQASWMPAVSGSNNIASLLSQQLFTGEYKEFDSRPSCFHQQLEWGSSWSQRETALTEIRTRAFLVVSQAFYDGAIPLSLWHKYNLHVRVLQGAFNW